MQIYTGNAYGKKLEKVIEYELGIMISTSPIFKPNKDFNQVPCALDNGAFSAWSKGYPFPEKAFLDTLDTCYKLNLTLDFIVCPDIVTGGEKSLLFSLEWAQGRLRTAPRLALVLQDGMTPEMIDDYTLSFFEVLFVGGTVEWKWKTAEQWVEHAHKHNKKCHIGQCGKLLSLRMASLLGVDSVDSTSFTRNSSWQTLDEFKSNITLFKI